MKKRCGIHFLKPHSNVYGRSRGSGNSPNSRSLEKNTTSISQFCKMRQTKDLKKKYSETKILRKWVFNKGILQLFAAIAGIKKTVKYVKYLTLEPEKREVCSTKECREIHAQVEDIPEA